MKKLICLLLVLVMALGLTACGECDHDWERATCEDPKTCSKCGETKGEPEAHEWEEEDGKTVCAECGEEKEDDEDEDKDDGDDKGASESTFTLYAYVPASWGTPGCWAWSNTTGENVFDAWPGATMNENGDYYSMEIPDWAEYVIVNGNGGSIQTQDEPVEPGCDVWVVIEEGTEYYEVFFSEPTADDLAELGY